MLAVWQSTALLLFMQFMNVLNTFSILYEACLLRSGLWYLSMYKFSRYQENIFCFPCGCLMTLTFTYNNIKTNHSYPVK